MRHKNILALSAFALLSGCGTTNLTLSSADAAKASAGTLTLAWTSPKSAETLLDGKRYAGEWSDRRCLTPECRGEYESVQGVHRSHIRRGAALLLAQDNSRLTCEWVSHYKEFVGNCRSDEGKQYRLLAGPLP
jgi:hypothetical protein